MHARMVCAPDFAVTSARLPFKESTLWMAARDADAAREDTFFPVDEQQRKRPSETSQTTAASVGVENGRRGR